MRAGSCRDQATRRNRELEALCAARSCLPLASSRAFSTIRFFLLATESVACNPRNSFHPLPFQFPCQKGEWQPARIAHGWQQPYGAHLGRQCQCWLSASALSTICWIASGMEPAPCVMRTIINQRTEHIPSSKLNADSHPLQDRNEMHVRQPMDV